MDKVKIYLALLKKHHFWLLCAVVFLTSIGVWWTGTEFMVDETKKRISKLESVQNEQRIIIQKGFQANDPTIDEARSLAIRVSRQVEDAWRKLYAAQRPKFQWPIGLREYKEICDKWDLEHPGEPFRDDVRRAYLNTMTQDLVKQRLRDLIQVLTVAQPSVSDEPRGLIERADRRERPQVEVKGLVKWGSTTPGATEVDRIFQYPWIDRPILVTDLEMRYAQEDLWVYEFLLDALATVNAGCDADKPEKALLKEIEFLKIGQEASAYRPASTIMTELATLSGSSLPGAGGEAGYGGAGPGFAGPGAGYGGEGGGSARAEGDELLKDERYCDVNGKPIPAAQLDAHLAAAQYKLMPVAMRLAMNQKELPKLLASLSNAVTPMRITQVQVYEGGSGSRVSQGGEDGGRAPIDISNDPRFSLDVTVEIRGMVHIFLPPKTAQFPHRLADAAQQAENGGLPPAPGVVPQPGLPQPGINDGQPGLPDPSAIISPDAPPPEAVPPAAVPGEAPAGAAPPGAAVPPGPVPPGAAAPPPAGAPPAGVPPGAGAPPANP